MSRKPKKPSKPSQAPRREDFPLEYLKDLNATKAAERCGYSRKTARVQGSRLLTDVAIQARIAVLKAERTQRAKVTSDRVLEEVDTLALGHIGEVLDLTSPIIRFKPLHELSENGLRLLQMIKIRYKSVGRGKKKRVVIDRMEFKFWDKTAALRLAMQHRGMLSERVLDLPTGDMTAVELERIAAGEDPLRVLADTRRG